ncbi:MAG: NDP-sugar synthase [Pyrobaculum sp.]
MRAVVLAAGLGTRLRPLTFFIPKPLAIVVDRPLIDYVLEWLRRNKVDEIAVVGHYMQQVLEKYLEEFHPDVVFFKSRKLLGTAGQLYYAKDWVKGDVFLINSDVLTNLDLSHPARLHVERGFQLTIISHRFRQNLRFGVLEEEGGLLKTWREKPSFEYITSTGIYVVNEEIISKLREEYLDMDKLATLYRTGLYVAKEAVFYDVGTLQDLKSVKSVELSDLKP